MTRAVGARRVGSPPRPTASGTAEGQAVVIAPDNFPHPIRVALITDGAYVRASLRHLLISSEAITVVQSLPAGGCAPTAPRTSLGGEVDVIVLDLAPGTPEEHRNQVQALPQNIPAVVLGADRAASHAAKNAGAPYLDKAEVADQLLNAVSATARTAPHRGQPHLPPRPPSCPTA